ncbi:MULTISPECIES: undecaprenyl-phosphate glucose phosphotransferase [Paraburkholderia]|uniref:Colanic acid biosynthesis UDP-glucose lipid carrier transferase n=1 Tax=Paraburkholderia tropica TaxID=92647 RepID=A0A1A5X1W7_9BURK|nr:MULTISPECIES: undecaprenyl-phosphate glucose phosphotransferase [Paraburkholderia]MBB2979000.1 putative colanic acid biosynthesis UDP-glucose lipid carrier transferase [Paraburkholderia tropica]MBB2999169.1 putative colanic acid biosynthesis UDP-glucose lipid carrier transferase [Paraburkholderia tropica]MBB6318931.1 putative colanic acid biosynthesis UDP-glucose lipid carrier transferase [Paraburkholderia tropica]MDE1138898.1 undecaprenyl-phosphate glucose phosphotransferase [Paraburkholder
MLSVLARIIDVAAIAAGALLAAALHHGRLAPLSDPESVALAFNCVLAIWMFPAFGIYQSWRGKSLYVLFARVCAAWVAVECTGILLSFSVHRADSLSRIWLAYWVVASVAFLIVSKALVHMVLRGLRREGYNHKAVAVVGSPRYARFLVEQMKSRPEAGFHPALVFDEDSDADGEAFLDGVPVARDLQSVIEFVREHDVREMWLALPITKERTIHRITMALRNDFVNIRFIPDVRSLSFFSQPVVDLLGVPAINLAASPVTDLRVMPKRVFDFLFAGCVLIALAPLFAVVGLAVKLTSRGPVFFKQRRKGLDGNEFEIYKFRSMKVHAEVAGQVTQARRGDPRVTRVGAFLRRTSLDELPQFINVLKGEMSVVGPRPHALAHDDIYKDLVRGYMARYRIKPGITGWAQVNGYRGETDRVEKMRDRVRFDLHYMQHWSFALDLRIVAMTMWKGFAGQNAY